MIRYRTFGCKANQYDTERMRQTLEAWRPRGPELCVVNTCTVTSRADADARRFIRRTFRERPGVRIVVAGCSAALHGDAYRAMDEVAEVVEGHDPAEVLRAAGGVTQLAARSPLDRTHQEPVGASVLRRRAGATRGWLKVQDGCDRKCSFCATRLARGPSRSRDPDEVALEARALARTHPELVVTGVHIGHYGRDLAPRATLAALVRRLLREVPARIRLGSIEATEVDDELLDLLAAATEDPGGASGEGDEGAHANGSAGRRGLGTLAPHLHMPLQSGADPVLRRMRRWHTREQYRRRALEIAAAVSPLGLGADIITGFPGETDADHAETVALVRELPFTYLHVFPYSPREGTAAAGLPDPAPQRIAGERSAELRALAAAKGAAHARSRGGQAVRVVLEGDRGTALTGDYLRVRVAASRPPSPQILHQGRLSPDGAAVELQ